jgi:hypothetical protein
VGYRGHEDAAGERPAGQQEQGQQHEQCEHLLSLRPPRYRAASHHVELQPSMQLLELLVQQQALLHRALATMSCNTAMLLPRRQPSAQGRRASGTATRRQKLPYHTRGCMHCIAAIFQTLEFVPRLDSDHSSDPSSYDVLCKDMSFMSSTVVWDPQMVITRTESLPGDRNLPTACLL